ncbi:hypothetical protein, partial [Acinetobacter junii]|uniref:hypothetical protein n=1 Tax=Acinetobacter junii TaxID=40215 RepID=UPI001C084C1E
VMTVFALFTHMACGATYALVPFIDREALGGVAGIIGAGGNVGDKVIEVDGQTTPTWEKLNYTLVDRVGETGQVSVVVDRNGT